MTVSNLKHLVKQIVCIPRFKTEHQQDDLPLSGGMCIRRPAVASASRWRPPRAAAASWGRQVARARRGAASPSGVWSARPAPVAWATQPAPAQCGQEQEHAEPRWRGRRSPHQHRRGAAWPGAGGTPSGGAGIDRSERAEEGRRRCCEAGRQCGAVYGRRPERSLAGGRRRALLGADARQSQATVVGGRWLGAEAEGGWRSPGAGDESVGAS